jgi:hypothetical protein
MQHQPSTPRKEAERSKCKRDRGTIPHSVLLHPKFFFFFVQLIISIITSQSRHLMSIFWIDVGNRAPSSTLLAKNRALPLLFVVVKIKTVLAAQKALDGLDGI